jgi:ATP-binding cassette subfamily B protein RaxB
VQSTSNKIVDKLKFWHKKDLPIIIQSEVAECGVTCLAMVACYHGYKIDLFTLRKIFSVSLEGTTLLDIMKFAERLELTSRPIKIELDDLKNLQTPCILHWDLDHFVVLKSANSKAIVIHDPAVGEKCMSVSEASKFFTGIALELTPTKEFEKKDVKVKLKLSDFWSKITGLKKSLILILVLSLMLQIFVLASPYYLQLVIDDVILTADTSLLTVLALGFFFILIFEVATYALRGFTLLHFGQLMNIQLASNLFHHLIRLPMKYFETRHMGDVISRFGSIQQIRHLLTASITETIVDGIMAIITLGMIFFYNVHLSLIVLATVSFYALVYTSLYSSFRKVSEQEIISKAEENSNFIESIRSIQTIKLFCSEVKREAIWQNSYAKTTNQSIRLGNYNLSFTTINRLFFGIENIIVIYFAAHLVIGGGFSTGMLFAFMAYKQQFMGKTANLIEKMLEFKMLGLHFDRLADIVLSDKEQLQQVNCKRHQVKGTITFKNVSFRYSDTTPEVVSNLNLEIKAGESVAITGPSGCGKSTVLKLMLGLDNPQQGEVYIDNLPLKQIGHIQYREQIAAVMQNDVILSGTIADNIAFFDANIDMNLVVYCAKLAAVHDDITLMAMGYNSLVGDMGSSLSGGQKQRVILARALYKKPKILFMDEATSHLDMKLEADINNAIKHLDITRIIIAHRNETIASADREINFSRIPLKN